MKFKLRIGIILVAVILLTQSTVGYVSSPIAPIPQEQFKSVPTPSSVIIYEPVNAPAVVSPPPRPVVEAKPERIVKNSTPSVKDAQAYALDKLGSVQYACVYDLWNKESGWSPTKYNYAGSGAYGIPQALPGSKMASAGADWRTNPVTQVKWGLGYISGRYGSACNAWEFSERNGWY